MKMCYEESNNSNHLINRLIVTKMVSYRIKICLESSNDEVTRVWGGPIDLRYENYMESK